MNKKTKICLIIVILLVFIGVAIIFFLNKDNSDNTVNGINDLSEKYTIELPMNQTLEVQD